MKPAAKPAELAAALAACRPFFRRALFFSFFINLLALAPTGYMLEVYDRVVNSRNPLTLAMLTLLVLGAYGVMEVCDWARREILLQGAQRFDAGLAERVFDAVFDAGLRRLPGASGQSMGDLRCLREFIHGPALLALIDIPLAALFLLVLFAISPVLALVAVAGALVQAVLAWFTERDTHPPLAAANRSAAAAQSYVDGTWRNVQVIEAMGMQANIQGRWMKMQRHFLALQAQASDWAGAYGAVSRFVQTSLSSLLLGLGCWLLLAGEFPGGGGMMVVASMLGGRVLGPIVRVIGLWKQVVEAREAYGRLDRLLQKVPAREAGMPLPPPRGMLSVEALVAGAPGSPGPILRGVSFALPAGAGMAVVGPSASGKSTLARLLVGVWPPAGGKVRLDGVDVYTWNKAELGPHVGYLPQEVELFDGTLAENIARFGEPDRAKVEAAARAVGIHDLIEALPQGYDTEIGDDGCYLSGGQRQRVGLARAVYGDPRLIVLDEPNSSLDDEGEQALARTLAVLKARGCAIVVITHRTGILAAVDRVLVLREGQVAAYGPRDEVLGALQRATAPPAPAAPLPAVA